MSYIPRAPCARILLHQRAADKVRRGETADSFQLRLRHQTALLAGETRACFAKAKLFKLFIKDFVELRN